LSRRQRRINPYIYGAPTNNQGSEFLIDLSRKMIPSGTSFPLCTYDICELASSRHFTLTRRAAKMTTPGRKRPLAIGTKSALSPTSSSIWVDWTFIPLNEKLPEHS
jgi:hypothetical protein